MDQEQELKERGQKKVRIKTEKGEKCVGKGGGVERRRREKKEQEIKERTSMYWRRQVAPTIDMTHAIGTTKGTKG